MAHSFTISRRDALLWGAACTLGAGSSAWAQGKYPEQTVKLIVALPPGGSVDMIARTLADRLKLSLGQAWIVDNRAGGSGQIGMPLVARAGPDGYTLAVSPASFLTTNKSIFKSLPYDPVTDFAPVSRLVNQPMVLVVNDKQKSLPRDSGPRSARSRRDRQSANSARTSRSAGTPRSRRRDAR